MENLYSSTLNARMKWIPLLDFVRLDLNLTSLRTISFQRATTALGMLR